MSASPLWRRVCCSVDGSTVSRAALEQAIQITRSVQGQLLLLHVGRERRPAAGTPFAPPRAVTEESDDAYLRGWTAHALESVPLTTSVELNGRAEEEIPRFVRQFACDLLVMGVSGEPGLRRRRKDAVAARVARCCPCPVLIVRENGGHLPVAQR